ncbi:MAG: putative maleylacetoacetate isomerase 2 isoform [Bacteriovoracaceae bacterium]|nr:putative maleylacetoacetate isomerase 2 isoform [Bacteriovoracaceae bacterium]
MKPILYNYFRSSSAYRVRIAFHLKKIDFEYRPINLLKSEQKSDSYLKINPKGEVPFLIDGNIKLSQSLAICEYLDAKWNEPLLFPQELNERMKCLEICELIGAGIQPAHNLAILDELTKRFGADDTKRADWCRHFMEKGLAALEKILEGTAGKYSLGNTLTAADIFLVPQVFAANRFKVDIAKFPIIKKVNDTCLLLEAFERAEPSRQIDAV